MTRTVGFFASVRQMNKGKQAEVKDRYQYYLSDVKKAIEAKREDI